jgi:taurine transport system substrate-binding protein
MNHPRHTIKALLALSIAILATALVACGSDDDPSDATASSDAPDKITIAYQAIPNGDLIVKNQGWLEKALPDTKIEWKLFDSGGTVNEAFAANSVDIGLAGSSPVARGLSQPIAYQVPWIHDVIGKAEALAVKSDIGSIADLKGKKIATPLASTSHYSLLAALEDAGLDQQDVEIVDAEPPDIQAAWERGDIDGAYVWNPTLAAIVKDGGKVLIDSAQLAKQGKTTYDLAVVSNELAEKYPDAVDKWAAQQNRAVELIRDDPTAASTAIGAELNLSPEEAQAQIDALIFLDAGEQAGADYLGGGLGTDLFNTAKFNQKLGQIPDVQPEDTYKKAVVPTFAESVGK